MGNTRFFDWLLAGIIWTIGLGSPTGHTIDIIGVYFPAILGALTVIPVYFLGKELFGRGAGVLAAGLIAILPGEFLGRSILGFTDHHVAETLFTSITILFLVLAIKTANRRQLTFHHLKRRDWSVSARPVTYSLLAGFFMGIYIFTFPGALLFVFLIFLYFVVQFIIDHLKNKSTAYLCIIGVIFFLLPLVTGRLIFVDQYFRFSLFIALLTPLVLYGISWLMTRKAIKPIYYPLSLVGLGLAGVGILYLASPSLIETMLSAFSVFRPTGAALTTIERQPIFRPWQDNPLVLVWGNFTISFFFSIIVLAYFVVFRFKQMSAEKNLLIVWSLVILAATIGQRRFAYYFAVNVALLSGYLSWQALRLAGFQDTGAVIKEAPKPSRRTTRPKDRSSHAINLVNKTLAVLIVFMIVYLPNLVPIVPNVTTAIDTARRPQFAPSDAWVSALDWMRENTPEPFNDPDAYYRLHRKPSPGGSFEYPESAYGVSAWWDYGYWITRIAHRIPNANPSQDRIPVTNIASFFTAQDEDSASKLREELDSSYVVIDHDTAYINPQTGSGKFYAVATWAGKNPAEFFDVYLTPRDNVLAATLYFYPEYYRSLAVHLYNFDGKEVTPETVPVIAYEERTDSTGRVFRIVTGQEQFDTYQEAEEYVSSRESGNYQIVGANPVISPVPLEALDNYRLVHSSDILVAVPGGATLPEVKVFEYIGTGSRVVD